MSARPNPVVAGLKCRCPNCSKGPLFSGFLKVRERCETCGADLSAADSGDGPVVFILLIVGAIGCFGLLFTEMSFHPPIWVELLIWLPLTGAMTLGALRPFKAVALMDARGADFEYEGEIPPDVALDPSLWDRYPFMRLTQPANLLVMPAIHSAAIATKLVQALGEVEVIGPMLQGLAHPVQICRLGDGVSRIITLATVAAFEAQQRLAGTTPGRSA